MRHRKAGKRLDRRDQERVALFRNLTKALVERFGTPREYILTSLAKAKAVRPFAERLITIAVKARKELDAAAKAAGTNLEGLRELHVKGDGQGKRKAFAKPRPFTAGKPAKKKKTAVAAEAPKTDKQQVELFPLEVRQHVARSLHLRRMVLSRLRHEATVKALIEKIAPRYLDRPGGYLKVLKTSQWVLGDASTKALIGFVGGPPPGQSPAPVDAEKKAVVGAK